MPVSSNHHNKKLTIHNIAEMAGVSAGTVSRVLNEQPGVGAETRAHIQEIIQQQGYRASFFARNLLARQSFAIGLVFSSTASELFAHPIYPELMGAIGDTLADEGYTLTLLTGSGERRNQRLLREAAEGRIDGVLLPDIRMGDEIVDALAAQETPTVVLGDREQRETIGWVDCDNDYAIMQLVEMLLEAGHTHIACINGPADFHACQLRMAGYHTAMRAAGLNVDANFEQYGAFSAEYGYQAAASLLQCASEKRPTAIVAGSDVIAAGCLEAAKALGVNVPEDLVLTGFDDNVLATFTHPALTTVKMPLKEMGRSAAHMLISFIKGEKENVRSLVLPCEIIVRESFRGSVQSRRG
jgi:LacI family transcriptional regulator